MGGAFSIASFNSASVGQRPASGVVEGVEAARFDSARRPLPPHTSQVSTVRDRLTPRPPPKVRYERWKLISPRQPQHARGGRLCSACGNSKPDIAHAPKEGLRTRPRPETTPPRACLRRRSHC
jgi:hypothetical protein